MLLHRLENYEGTQPAMAALNPFLQFSYRHALVSLAIIDG
jgi:hypothetical protein